MKDAKPQEDKPLRFLKLIEKPIPRPPTPEISIPSLVIFLLNYFII
jgi:hypothetical protein